jgi:hypothetical protein
MACPRDRKLLSGENGQWPSREGVYERAQSFPFGYTTPADSRFRNVAHCAPWGGGYLYFCYSTGPDRLTWTLYPLSSFVFRLFREGGCSDTI